MPNLKKILIISAVFASFLTLQAAEASRAVNLPWSLNFDDNSWVNDLARTECGGTSSHTADGCFSGGCMKVTPPTSPCTGSGSNGGATGLGWVTYPGTSRFHIRFLVKFGPGWPGGVRDGGGGVYNKFLLQDANSRSGILGFTCISGSCAWGVLDSSGSYRYTSPGIDAQGRQQYSGFAVTQSSHVNEWMSVEYWIDTSTGSTGAYINTQSGSYTIEPWPAPVGISQTAMYISYYNCYGNGAADNYYQMDNITISNSYIGPPAGFVSGGTPPPARRGDLNADSRVDVTDLGILLGNWGATSRPASDLNQDGRVDVTDLGILLGNWG